MRYLFFLFIWIASCNLTVNAQEEISADSNAVVTNSFWDNWYLQVGMDMALQNPYGTDFSKVFLRPASLSKSLDKSQFFLKASKLLPNDFP